MTDEQLMHQVKNGKLGCLRTLFEKYQTPLYRFFLRNGRDQASAEDMVQNVFERILKYRNSFGADKKFKPWAYSIAYNISKDEYRKRSNYQVEDELDHHSIQQDNVMHKIIRNETLSQAKRALAKLSAEAQEIIWLNWNEKMRYKEIGDVMGMTESAARVKAHRAIKKLQEEFQKLDLS